MAKILEKRLIRPPDVYYYKIGAPLISKKAQPGQFVIIRLHDKGERIPLSLADINPSEGTISLIVRANDESGSQGRSFPGNRRRDNQPSLLNVPQSADEAGVCKQDEVCK